MELKPLDEVQKCLVMIWDKTDEEQPRTPLEYVSENQQEYMRPQNCRQTNTSSIEGYPKISRPSDLG